MVYYRNSSSLREFIRRVLVQISSPSWSFYIECKSIVNNADWNCDQDMLIAMHLNTVLFQDKFGIKIQDVGYKYNFCPGSDIMGNQAAAVLLKWAFIESVYPVLHFKADMKNLLYEPGFGKLLRFK